MVSLLTLSSVFHSVSMVLIIVIVAVISTFYLASVKRLIRVAKQNLLVSERGTELLDQVYQTWAVSLLFYTTAFVSVKARLIPFLRLAGIARLNHSYRSHRSDLFRSRSLFSYLSSTSFTKLHPRRLLDKLHSRFNFNWFNVLVIVDAQTDQSRRKGARD